MSHLNYEYRKAYDHLCPRPRTLSIEHSELKYFPCWIIVSGLVLFQLVKSFDIFKGHWVEVEPYKKYFSRKQ